MANDSVESGRDRLPGLKDEVDEELDAAAEFIALIRGSSAVVRDCLRLLAVEGRLFGRSLVVMMMLADVIGILVASAWLLVAGTIAWLLIEMELLSLYWALLATAGANLLLAALVWYFIQRLSANLAFKEFKSLLRSMLAAESEKKEP